MIQVSTRHAQFEALVRACAADLYQFAYWLCGDAHQAEDLVQETFARAWRSLHTLRESSAAKGWLFTILRREHLRGVAGPRAVEDEGVDVELLEAADPAPGPERQEAARHLRRALLALPAAYRTPLLLQVLGGYSCREIARTLGLGENAVMTRLFRARQRLRQALAEEAPRPRRSGRTS